MSANQWGHRLVMMSFGESHGQALGVIVDGVPAGLEFDQELLSKNLARRRPGQASTTTSRSELDLPEVLSGILEGKTLGTPIAILVRNQDSRSQDYKELKPRAGHADSVWKDKFGIHDLRGGGRASGRETVSRVMAGSVAQMLVNKVSPKTQVLGFCSRLGPFELTDQELRQALLLKSVDSVDAFPLRFPSAQATAAEKALELTKSSGDSWGGQVTLVIRGATRGLGQPVFAKLKSDLSAAMSSVGAVCAVEWGEGVDASKQRGSEFHTQNRSVYGGIQGGIATGEDILLRVSFKPTSSIGEVALKGRHDPCIVPRALPVLESMAWFVLADHLLWMRTDRAQGPLDV